MQILWFLIGCIGGAVVTWFIAGSRMQLASTVAQAERKSREEEALRLRESLSLREQALTQRDEELAAARKEAGEARVLAASLEATQRAEQQATNEKIQALMDVEKNLKASFEALAANALDANSKRLMALARLR